MIAPETVFLSHDTILESDVQVGPFVVFGPKVIVKSGAEIRAFSHLEGAEIAGGAIIGPYARPKARRGDRRERPYRQFRRSKEGSHRERRESQSSHLHRRCARRRGRHIGAGTITCNYDGFEKHFTDIARARSSDRTLRWWRR